MHGRVPKVHEYCRRCRQLTATRLPDLWARRIAIGCLCGLVLSPLAAPLLVVEPILAFLIILPFGLAAGPVARVLRSGGSCVRCGLERPGSAVRRLGLKRFLIAPQQRPERAALRLVKRDDTQDVED